jgi:hypothetical protein
LSAQTSALPMKPAPPVTKMGFVAKESGAGICAMFMD